jgi:copper chaperone
MTTTTTSSTTSINTDYQVDGMTCGHCATAVREELLAVGGVTDVRVELPTGRITVTSTRQVARDEVATAVDEAGYRLV